MRSDDSEVDLNLADAAKASKDDTLHESCRDQTYLSGTYVLISAEHVRGNTILKFYDIKRHVMELLNAGRYAPYAYVESDAGIVLHDLVTGTDKKYQKVPRGHATNVYETDMVPEYSYLYDHNLVPGLYYTIQDGKIIPSRHDSDNLSGVVLERILGGDAGRGLPDKMSYDLRVREITALLGEDVPNYARVAFDIELESSRGILNVDDPTLGITAISFASPSESTCMLVGDGTQRTIPAVCDSNLLVMPYGTEAEMLQAAFDRLESYPFWITYYGSSFDIPYMYNRASRLGLDVQNRLLHRIGRHITPIKSVHLDMHSVFSNPSLHAYAFGSKYDSFSLDDVSRAMLGRGKTGTGEAAGGMEPDTLARYCYADSRLTYDLTAFGSDSVMAMLTMISRICCMPLDAVSDTRISSWIQSMWYRDHRRNGYIIPRRHDLDKKNAGSGTSLSAEAVIRGKKYRGGRVMDQKCGTYWGMKVLDFASMYPHIMQLHNLSYETVMCPHEACRANMIPHTGYWTCLIRNGMLAEGVGALRELRVRYYKPLSRNENVPDDRKKLYEIVAGTIKVLVNASSGVMGSEHFPLYFLPVADATTAIGRGLIADTVSVCEKNGVEVLYGDTDSVFVNGADDETIRDIISEIGRTHGAELEVDKEYRLALLSGLKKNYLGIRNDGTVDIKGLSGRKSNTPKIIHDAFGDVMLILSRVQEPSEMHRATSEISETIRRTMRRINTGNVMLSEMAYKTKITKDLFRYDGNPQHVVAARKLEHATGARVTGTIRFVKTRGGVEPYELARASDLDTKKYMVQLESVMDQVLLALGTSTAQILAGTTQDSIDAYFAG